MMIMMCSLYGDNEGRRAPSLCSERKDRIGCRDAWLTARSPGKGVVIVGDAVVV